MIIQKKNRKWKIGGIGTVAAIFLICASVSAENNAFKYPIKRHVTGTVMSLELRVEKGRDREIVVNERVYRVSSKTVMVDQGENKTGLEYFKIGNKVTMVVDVYQRYNEALFIAPKAK